LFPALMIRFRFLTDSCKPDFLDPCLPYGWLDHLFRTNLTIIQRTCFCHLRWLLQVSCFRRLHPPIHFWFGFCQNLVPLF
jgi:hypothetical protein